MTKKVIKTYFYTEPEVCNVRTVGELLVLANKLFDTYGDIHFSVGDGREYSDQLWVEREETDDEYSIRLQVEAKYREMFNSHDAEVHKQIVREYGYEWYLSKKNELCEGRK